jgi:hypothetical protein
MPDSTDAIYVRLVALERQLRWHRRAGFGALALVSVLVTAAFQAVPGKGRFVELDVERLNVVEPDGQLVLAIANTARLPDPLIAGKTVETGRTGPGLIFFDGKGWEVGGLTYSTRETSEGYRAGGHLSFDQFRNDQVVYLNYQDDGKRKSAGLYVVDRARTPRIDELLRLRDEMQRSTGEARQALEEKLRASAAQRVFVGSTDETAMVRLRDRAGRDRIRLSVAPDGAAVLEFLDADGKVVERLPK